MNTSQSDLQFIESQLGRKPRGLIKISVRSKDGRPLVIKTKPILVKSQKSEVKSDIEIFPTLYYLVDQKLIKQVNKLESEGLLGELQDKVDSDENFGAEFLQAQEEYSQERNSLVDVPLNESQKEALETGIGGVKDFSRVKCLHCHLAHYLATGNNPAGKEVSEILRPSASRMTIDRHSEQSEESHN